MNHKEVIDILQQRIYEWEMKPNDRLSSYYGCNERVNDIIQNLKGSIEDIKEGDFPGELLDVYVHLGIDATMPINVRERKN